MSETVTFALIAVILVVLLLFWLASAHYVSELLEELGEDDDHNGHGGAGH